MLKMIILGSDALMINTVILVYCFFKGTSPFLCLIGNRTMKYRVKGASEYLTWIYIILILYLVSNGTL